MPVHKRSRGLLISVVLGALAAAPVSARAADEPARAFFQGKQIRFYTMGSPGGGYDAYMRALIPHLERKLGAKLIPTNEPGAGGLVAMNRMLTAAPDGSTILLMGGETLVTAQLYESPGVNFDVRKLTWLARVSNEAKVALLGPKSPYHSVADLKRSDKPVIWAGSGKIDGNVDFAAILVHALDARSKIIAGYRGTADMNLAIQRGEVDGRVVSEEAAALYGPSGGMRVLVTLARKRAEQRPAVLIASSRVPHDCRPPASDRHRRANALRRRRHGGRGAPADSGNRGQRPRNGEPEAAAGAARGRETVARGRSGRRRAADFRPPEAARRSYRRGCPRQQRDDESVWLRRCDPNTCGCGGGQSHRRWPRRGALLKRKRGPLRWSAELSRLGLPVNRYSRARRA